MNIAHPLEAMFRSSFSLTTVFFLIAINFGSDTFTKQALANSKRPTHKVTQVRGRVQFKKNFSSNYRTVSVGTKLHPGYLLRLGEGAIVGVECNSGSNRTLIGSGIRGVNEICLVEARPREAGRR